MIRAWPNGKPDVYRAASSLQATDLDCDPTRYSNDTWAGPSAQDWPVFVADGTFLCPKCRDVCSCKSCRVKRGVAQPFNSANRLSGPKSARKSSATTTSASAAKPRGRPRKLKQISVITIDDDSDSDGQADNEHSDGHGSDAETRIKRARASSAGSSSSRMQKKARVVGKRVTRSAEQGVGAVAIETDTAGQAFQSALSLPAVADSGGSSMDDSEPEDTLPSALDEVVESTPAHPLRAREPRGDGPDIRDRVVVDDTHPELDDLHTSHRSASHDSDFGGEEQTFFDAEWSMQPQDQVELDLIGAVVDAEFDRMTQPGALFPSSGLGKSQSAVNILADRVQEQTQPATPPIETLIIDADPVASPRAGGDRPVPTWTEGPQRHQRRTETAKSASDESRTRYVFKVPRDLSACGCVCSP